VSFDAIISSPAFAGAVAGLISGALASLVAPWIQWGVEKRRLQRNERRELLERARGIVTSVNDPQSFRNTPEYARLRPHLLDEVRNKIEGRPIVPGTGEGRGTVRNLLLDDFARIERKWGIT
jgi:hypothetical protein